MASSKWVGAARSTPPLKLSKRFLLGQENKHSDKKKKEH